MHIAANLLLVVFSSIIIVVVVFSSISVLCLSYQTYQPFAFLCATRFV